jgi:hypothetical protein
VNSVACGVWLGGVGGGASSIRLSSPVQAHGVVVVYDVWGSSARASRVWWWVGGGMRLVPPKQRQHSTWGPYIQRAGDGSTPTGHHDASLRHGHQTVSPHVKQPSARRLQIYQAEVTGCTQGPTKRRGVWEGRRATSRQ